jgi:hypothetical protein
MLIHGDNRYDTRDKRGPNAKYKDFNPKKINHPVPERTYSEHIPIRIPSSNDRA